MAKILKFQDKKDGGRIQVQVSDDLTLDLSSESTRKLTPEGYLKATAAVTRVGVQFYPSTDFGIDSDELIGVFRPHETVFHTETADSLKLKPITFLHPEMDVDSKNHNRLSVGTVGETVEAIDADRLGASIQITDDGMVQAILGREIGELSLGYDAYVVSEQGEYMGEKYLYRFDGPMLNNHLAIVPEGRCGDTVKILDQGGGTVNKEQMIKLLRDAGVSEKKIKAFMAKKDNAAAPEKGDIDEFAKLLAGVGDIDMSQIIPGIIAEIKPAIEEMISSEEFTAMLAKEVATGMVGPGAAAGGGEEDDDGDQDPEEMTPEMMDAAVKDRADKKIRVIDAARPFIKDEGFDFSGTDDKDIVLKALDALDIKGDAVKDKSFDYLFGMLTAVGRDRADAIEARRKIKSTVDAKDPRTCGAPIGGIAAKALKKE